jgi:citrate synthase
MSRTLSAREAAERLGVSRATLYAYVSRGLVRSESGEDGRRDRRYLAEDVETLARRTQGRRDPARAVQEALHWGAPLLDSALTLIEDGRLFYRGRDVTKLAAGRHAGRRGVPPLDGRGRDRASETACSRACPDAPDTWADTPAEGYAVALARAAAHDLAGLDDRPGAGPRAAARVLGLLFAVTERLAGVPARPDLPLHARLAAAWAPGEDAAPDLLRRALVCCADHELNVSSFTARCVASSGANLHHAALAGLCALQGPRHGLAAELAFDLVADARARGSAVALRAATRGREGVPGFIIRSTRTAIRAPACSSAPSAPRCPTTRTCGPRPSLIEEVHGALDLHPTVDLGLAVITRALNLTGAHAVATFALGRTAGWLAHALEAARRAGCCVRAPATWGRVREGCSPGRPHGVVTWTV